MQFLTTLTAALSVFVAAATAFPATSEAPAAAALHARAVYPTKGEPPYSQNVTDYKGAITCLPATLGSAPGGVVLLIHGTGSTGGESWLHGPYTDILPTLSPGFDVCYLTLPYRALRDAQVSAEYVVYAVKSLALKSATKKVSIIGHSQGAGVNPQWAMAYWPSILKKISSYVAISGDFRGVFGNVTDAGVSTKNLTVLSPSLFQQFAGSHYMAAQNRIAPAALTVNTTSIYSAFDEVVRPSSSKLDGAANFLIQDLCGPIIVDHFLQVVEFSTFALAYDALLNGKADASRFKKTYCNTYVNGSKKKLINVLPNLYAVAADIANIVFTNKSPGEPLLKPYVCAKDASVPAANCGDSGYFP
ncbi:hypothetical protein OC846_003199 [Tilletia horrida]|uniref:AB hydrolase-1 domain-containing protein n=1 Tax=Tilletia horrida TaxID=155126 RepID=A0AAN6JRI3_9BASI|nr:hypothetical protein OC845_003754 [Tilletia horrida]KAK0551707.1 hypothetical protein OC846_003199 [Tilletia horrida]KAK0569680.1 hypothetical protein OC861_000640 [Tilletia horrida]